MGKHCLHKNANQKVALCSDRLFVFGYWMRMFMTFAIEAPIATAIFISGHVTYLLWLVLVMAVFIHVNRVFSVDLAERQARKFAVPETEQPVAAVVLSLKTRRLSDYSNRQVERVIVLSTIFAFAWLVRYYLTDERSFCRARSKKGAAHGH